jgi:hypothetical protein
LYAEQDGYVPPQEASEDEGDEGRKFMLHQTKSNQSL